MGTAQTVDVSGRYPQALREEGDNGKKCAEHRTAKPQDRASKTSSNLYLSVPAPDLLSFSTILGHATPRSTLNNSGSARSSAPFHCSRAAVSEATLTVAVRLPSWFTRAISPQIAPGPLLSGVAGG